MKLPEVTLKQLVDLMTANFAEIREEQLRQSTILERLDEQFKAIGETIDTIVDNMVVHEDITNMATKADIVGMASKEDIAHMATKADIAHMATKSDIADMATKADIAQINSRIDNLSEKIDQQIDSDRALRRALVQAAAA